MSPPKLSACATLVRQLDPDLFHAALFAPEPARERLLVLYAFDIELSKAAAKVAEPMIAAMRLQWWRDLVAGIAAGDPPRKHEVAEPLHGVLSADALPPGDLAALIDAREMELEGPLGPDSFAAWLDGRFGALTRLAAHLLVDQNPAAQRAATAVGQAMGVAFVLRSAVALAQVNRFVLPDLTPADRAELARGRTTGNIRATAHRLADQALATLIAARRETAPKAVIPALLPVWRAERVLRRAQRSGFDLAADLAQLQATGPRGIAFGWRALRGRW